MEGVVAGDLKVANILKYVNTRMLYRADKSMSGLLKGFNLFILQNPMSK
jgi:hypothetical protein